MKAMVILILIAVSIGMGATTNGLERTHSCIMTDVSVLNQTEKNVSIIISVSGEVPFHVFRVADPERLVIEIVDTIHNCKTKAEHINGSIIKGLRSAQFRNSPVKIVRVVCDMVVENYIYEAKQLADQIQVILSASGQKQSQNFNLSGYEDENKAINISSKVSKE